MYLVFKYSHCRDGAFTESGNSESSSKESFNGSQTFHFVIFVYFNLKSN